jgi:oligopeptide/dipeptide ABC transporter ATP-binding protein
LDVSMQAQIMNLLADLQESLDLSMLFISHQLPAIRYLSTRVAIMYLGKIVEVAPVERIFNAPGHPYTQALLDSAPVPVPKRRHRNPALVGDIPSPMNIPSGCRFRTRCRFAVARCEVEEPLLRKVTPTHSVACHILPFYSAEPSGDTKMQQQPTVKPEFGVD